MSQPPSRSCFRLWIAAWWAVLLSGWAGIAASQQFSFRQYAQSDGLTNLAAGYLLTDPGGDLWVGTDGGLFRFDGTAFVPYDTAQGIPSETVRGLALDSWNRLWVSLDRGLYVGQRSGFAALRTAEGPVVTDHSLPIAFLGKDHVLIAKKGRVLELRSEHPDTGLWRSTPFFPAEQLKAQPQLDKVVSFYTARDGTLWLGCDKQLCSLLAGKLRTWGPAQGVPEGSYGAFLVDRDDRLWVRSGDHLRVRADGRRF